MALTVTEKEFWKQRIAARIERAIERIQAQHPALFERLQREAHTQGLQSLGLAESYAELEQIQADEAALARRKSHVQRAMVARLRGVPIAEVSEAISIRYGGALPLPLAVSEALGKRQAAQTERLLAADPIGQQITRLEIERERLLDVVWLASSPAQIKQLWSKVGSLLEDEPTQLERDALAIEPVAEG